MCTQIKFQKFLCTILHISYPESQFHLKPQKTKQKDGLTKLKMLYEKMLFCF